jgi:hypothetical protein
VKLNSFIEIKKIERKPILLTENNIMKIIDKRIKSGQDICSIEFNNDPPTEEILFSNTEKGISFKIPYNPNWGNNNYKITPYFNFNDSLTFGRLYVSPEACGWVRTCKLSFNPQRSAEEILKTIKDFNNSQIAQGSTFNSYYELEKNIINGNTIVKYSIPIDPAIAAPDTHIIEIVGKKYNYAFDCNCVWIDYQQGICPSEDIIKNVKFIE